MKRMFNSGLHQYRFNDNPEEKKFAVAWEALNDRPTAPCQVNTLRYVLGDGMRPVEPTPREREVVATVIQWLGSPVGQCWLRDLGYERRAK